MSAVISEPATIRSNAEAWLKALGLSHALIITREDEDRCYGWFSSPAGVRVNAVIAELLSDPRWWKNPKVSTEHYHGVGGVSWREKGVSPSAQIVIYRPAPQDAPEEVYFELDFDEYFGLGHAWEVVRNTATGAKTDQTKIAALLAKRFGRKATA